MPVCPHFPMELHIGPVCAVPDGKYVGYIPQPDEPAEERMRIEDGRAPAPGETDAGIDRDRNAATVQNRRTEGTECNAWAPCLKPDKVADQRGEDVPAAERIRIVERRTKPA